MFLFDLDFVEKYSIDILIPQNVLTIPMQIPLGVAVTEFLAETGMPAISMPAGFTSEGLPVGIQIVGGFRKDRSVLEIAKAFEVRTNVASQLPNVLSAD